MKFSVFQISRKGGREKNEDRMGYCYTNSSALFLLADGMGGHPEGEVAAQLALQTISALYQKEAKPELQDVKSFFNTAIIAAHRQILRYAADGGLNDTPRTTLVAAVVQGGVAHWMHCGDSRLYFVRDGEMLARTRDHSYLEQHQGSSKPPTLPAGINRNVLYTCLGSPTKPIYEVTGPVPLQQGDKVLLCSDGLWGSLPDVDIVFHLGQKPVSVAAPELAERALLKAGASSDNVTLVAMEWETPDVFESTRGSISTENMDNAVFASTVQTGSLDASDDDLDDAAIERSIAEINAAIRRTATRKS
ncbi:serine/threonine protein phosphatase [Rhodoferax lacus]|uniref:Serine/threonine protein phosphatase n=1 Tax=Rhodoferax lacus TaxID=2184758 RepID=A0A3E1RE09_9BURK|nr:PP2C family serine/threonine-protein phosphatase [Rhodoferax lacus]RFO97604.1 serine/threonine protein phosphatase [Rhodoferax lacus]